MQRKMYCGAACLYDVSPGSVLGDLLELVNAAFAASDVPACWACAHLSAIFKTGGPML